ncbi:MAG: response regulator [Anaerolineales bacterium]|jgi:CheY-like chemotaxis protein
MNGLEADNPEFNEFENQLQNSLNHLYDSEIEPAEIVFRALGLPTASGSEAVQKAIKDQIERMKPEEDTPVYANSRKYYELLNYRYVQMLSQEETSYKLGITARHLRRFQHQAVHAMALQIWSKRIIPPKVPEDLHNSQLQSLEKDLLYQELQNLDKNSPGVMSNLSESLDRVKVLAQAMLPPSVGLKVENTDPAVMASIHPSILNQLLLTCLQQIGKQFSSGDLRLQAHHESGFVNIQLSAKQVCKEKAPTFYPVPELLNLLGGVFAFKSSENSTEVELTIPSAEMVKVLVIDDNPDIVHFYKRFLSRTRYLMRDVNQGALVAESIAKERPDIIVLDVMLPDMDGWELLAQLKSLPVSKDIPVIICSVLGQEELAISLGAKAYLSKPVGRVEFIEALDHAAKFI